MIREIKGFCIDPYELFSWVKDEPHPVLLESGMDPENLGRYSIIAWDPYLLITSGENEVEIRSKTETKVLKEDPFDVLERELLRHEQGNRESLPFVGGAIGFFSYDLKNRLENLSQVAVRDIDFYHMHFGFYDEVVVIDHLEEKTYGASYGITDDPSEILDRIEIRINQGLQALDTEASLSLDIDDDLEDTVFTSNFTKEEYMKALDRIHEYIRQGEIYQTNLTQRFCGELKASPELLYQVLRKKNPAPFASYIPTDQGTIVSSSPERFLKRTAEVVETRPIKGTVPRGQTPEEDEKYRNQLSNSEKDKAELLMIVDLERNDLGKVAQTGSVQVTELYKIETYPTVFHLVSTVKAKMKDDQSSIDLIKATFPGGSITGAPKIRAMEIIDHLEPTTRNIYTGAIGYIDLNGDLDLNIVIRTFLCKDGKAYFQAGGGIVWDSDNELEYEETFHKAAALMKSLDIANKLVEYEQNHF